MVIGFPFMFKLWFKRFQQQREYMDGWGLLSFIFIPFLNVLPSPNEKLRETNWGWWDLKVIFALASHFAPKWLVSYKTHTLWLYNTKLGGLLFGIFNILNISRKVSIFRLYLSQIVFLRWSGWSKKSYPIKRPNCETFRTRRIDTEPAYKQMTIKMPTALRANPLGSWSIFDCE